VEKLQSLADFLGIKDASVPDAPAPTLTPPTLSVAAFCTEVLNTVQYRESILRRILMDSLPAQLECLLFHYAYGKPVERVEVKDTSNNLEDLTAEQLEERALYLAETARRMRQEASSEQVH
jgi:hypothetical protein